MKSESQQAFELWASFRVPAFNIKGAWLDEQDKNFFWYDNRQTDYCWKAWQEASKQSFQDGYNAAINFIAGG